MRAPEHWRVFPDTDSLADEAVEDTIAAIASGGARPAVCLTGGSSPRGLYSRLAQDAYARRIPWERTHWFVGDERFVPESNELSNMGQARRLFLDRHAPPENVHPVPIRSLDLAQAAEAYDETLRKFQDDPASPLFALVLLGVGPDGHVASLFPGSPALCEERRRVVPVEQPGLAPFTPRVTLTPPALRSCRRMLLLATGSGKAAVVSRLRAGEDLPAQRVAAEAPSSWLVDSDADPGAARLILVMGVSGAGKTTIGGELAARLGWAFLDADALHPRANVEKMRAGAPLTDVDRAPWLEALRIAVGEAARKGADLVLACSALTQRYRNRILDGNRNARIVFLRGAPDLIAARLGARRGHFMPPDLLASQYDLLQAPPPDEHAIIVDVEAPPSALVDDIVTRLGGFARKRG